MTLGNLLRELGRRSIELKKNDNDLEYRGSKDALDYEILRELKSHKCELIEWLGDEKNTWCLPQSIITPDMLPLITLTQGEIDCIIESTPGGADNIQDIYPLAPLQEGILFHHLMSEETDAYILSSIMALDNHELLDKFLSSFQLVVNRYDILRTAILWENLPEPVQVVCREAEIPIEDVTLDLSRNNKVDQMKERYTGGNYRIDIRKAPMIRAFIASDEKTGRWILAILHHHLIMDHTTIDIVYQEIFNYIINGEEILLPEALPFRNNVARTRLGVSQEEHEAFFRKMLSDVEEPTAPYGLLDVRGNGSDVEEAWYNIDITLSHRLRDAARKLRVSAASVFHLAWARVLGSLSNRDDVVFGTVLFGRMQGGEGAERVMGMLINTLPVRIEVKEDGVEEAIKKTHHVLADLLHHEYARLALAQRCSGVVSPMPLFSSLLNYRYLSMPGEGEDDKKSGIGIEGLYSEERTNYPFVMSVNDLGEGYSLTALIQSPVDPSQVCSYMNTVLEHLADALENTPQMAIGSIDVLSEEKLTQILYEWNDTKAEYPDDKCIHELFEEQAEKTPDAVAVVFENEQISYRELNLRANQLAHFLIKVGVNPGD
ncbi:MAG: condensation domain-containing protein, partial [Desulfobacteraceae bacterium]